MHSFTTSPMMKISRSSIGKERAPLLIVDNFIHETNLLVNVASHCKFEKNSPFYPGVRAPSPNEYQDLLLSSLGQTLVNFFNLPSAQLSLSVCHYSIVTTPAHQLNLLQRIPHFDSLDGTGLAAVHYLFEGDKGGTAFYRHRKTEFETIDESRKVTYFRSLESENDGPNMPKVSDGYINGDSPLFECVKMQPSLFNRIIIYRRNSLHSGSIPNNFTPPSNPLNGRLTISSFIDCF